MDPGDLVLRGGRLLLSGDAGGDVRIANGRIVEIGRGLLGKQVIDVRDLWVVPGLIDLFLYCLRRWGFPESASLNTGDQIRLTTVDGSAIASAGSDYSSPGRRI